MRLAAAALFSLVLTGCSGIDLFGASSSQQPKQIVNSSQLQSELDQRGSDAPARRSAADVPTITPEALIGASGRQIESWLGAPDAHWSEGGHSLWRYAATDCVVLLFVDPGETVRKVSLLRQDGSDGPGCERAISERFSGAQTS